MLLLAIDLGGTKTLLHLSELNRGQVQLKREQRYASANYESLSDILEDFCTGESISACCIAVAGPVHEHDDHQRAQITNLPWTIESRHISKQLGNTPVVLINDFQAIGHALSFLSSKDYVVIQVGESAPQSNQAIIGAGTGLGEAFVTFSDSGYFVHPSEGGHGDFAPTDDLQIELLRYMLKQKEHVSYECLLSGSGLVYIYQFLCEFSGAVDTTNPSTDTNREQPSNIALQAQQDPSSIAGQAMGMFVRLYGAEAGNVALKYLPFGGLYLSGGIAAKNSSQFLNGEFLNAFRAKGKMRQLMNDFPVRLITNPDIGVIGATKFAEKMLSQNEYVH